MATQTPTTELHRAYSQPDATPTPWATALATLTNAEIYWLSTVRPDGHPHVTPLIAIWLDGALYFSTGPGERKAKNLIDNPHCVITTGCNTISQGIDLVIEGEARRVTDEARLQRLATAYVAKYGEGWTFTVRDGTFFGEGGEVWLYEVTPTTAFGFGKGTFSQTRWRF